MQGETVGGSWTGRALKIQKVVFFYKKEERKQQLRLILDIKLQFGAVLWLGCGQSHKNPTELFSLVDWEPFYRNYNQRGRMLMHSGRFF